MMQKWTTDGAAAGGTVWWKRHWVHLVAVGGLALGVGAAMGGDYEAEQVIVAGPQVTVTPSPEPAVTVTSQAEPIQVEVVKPECLTALDRANDFIYATADLMSGPVAGMFEAASNWDVDGLDRNLAQFNSQADSLLATQAEYVAAAEVCRG